MAKPLVTCLWFDGAAEEAANYYVGIFEDAKLGGILRTTDAGPGPEGSVLTVDFELNGQRFTGLNGGPEFKFSEAISFEIHCADQAEVDYYWEKLGEGGQEGPCGWLKDKYGVSWQVVPEAFLRMVAGPDQEKAARAMKAMFSMGKLDLAELEKAYAGE